MYLVDVPNAFDSEWDHVATFRSKEKAIEFCKERFGADDDGKVSLLTEIDYGEPEESSLPDEDIRIP